MIAAQAIPASRALDPRPPAGRLWSQAALVILLACLAARCFVSELPFRLAVVKTVASQQAGQMELKSRTPDLGELSRVVLAAALLAACVLWAVGQARGGVITINRPWLVGAVALFAILSAASAVGAADKREAWTVWLEQVSLMGSCALAVQLFRQRGSMRLLLTVLAAVGVTLAIKGLWQMMVEFPANAEYMDMYGVQALREAGQSPGSPEAEMFRKRFLATTPYGYFNLSNPFGSLLIILGFAATGLGAWKLIAALADRKKSRTDSPSGQIHLPTLGAVLTLAAAAVVLALLVLTKSRGAIAAAVIAAAAAVAVFLTRRRLVAHWRRYTTAAGVCVLLAAAAVVYMGISRDRLPSRTMTFRWYYWTGSARIIEENPWLGVGGGNFPDAYLRSRRVEGEEAIKMPHNAVVNAAVQYGLAGGLLYAGILAWVLAGLARPCRLEQPPEANAGPNRAPIVMLALVASAVLAVRWAALSFDTDGALVFLDVLCPLGVFLAALVLAWWSGGQVRSPFGAYSAARLMLACGVAGFALHNMVTFSLWLSGTALVFWVCAGSCLAGADAGKPLRLAKLRWPAVGLGAAATLGAVVFLCAPVADRWTLSRRMVDKLEAGDVAAATKLAQDAAMADPLDAQAAADAARIMAYRGRTLSAIAWSEKAIARNPASSRHYRLTAYIRRSLNMESDRALEYMAGAVDRNPMAARLRIEFAEMLLDRGHYLDCLTQIDRALYIDAHLPHAGRAEGSVMRLRPGELAALEALRRKASAQSVGD